MNFKDSLILKRKEDLDKFYELISKKVEINNMKLIYRYSKDRLGYENIVNKIDNKSNLIFLFLTGNNRIFGNYTKTKLENIRNSNDHYYKDEKAFVFSLNNNKIYKVLIPTKAIRLYKDESVIYTSNSQNGNGFYISGNTITESLIQEPKIYDFERNNELTQGENKINELEIFEIKYDY